jgi:hypothetical protein
MFSEAPPSNWITNLYTTWVWNKCLPLRQCILLPWLNTRGNKIELARCHGQWPLAPQLLDIGCLDYWRPMQHMNQIRSPGMVIMIIILLLLHTQLLWELGCYAMVALRNSKIELAVCHE